MSAPSYYDPGQPGARRTDPETSHLAAASMSEERITALQTKVLRAMVKIGGRGINDEIVNATGEPWNTVTPRMKPLERLGMIAGIGKRKSARTNRKQIEWEITDAGQRFVMQQEHAA